MESEDFFQVTKHLRRQFLVGIEMISLRLALHFLSVIHLGVVAAAAQGFQLAQDILEAVQRCVVFCRLWRTSVKETRKGTAVQYHLRGEVCNARLANLTTRKSNFRNREGVGPLKRRTLLFLREGNERSLRHRRFR